MIRKDLILVWHHHFYWIRRCVTLLSKSVKPHIVQDIAVPQIIRLGGISIPEYREEAYHIVLSIDLGNTTTACVIVGTNLASGLTYIIDKKVWMIHSIRPPKKGEEIFGKSLDGTILSRNAVEEHIRDIIKATLKESKIDPSKDLDYLVHTTGLVGQWESDKHINSYLGCLSKGCMDAGIPPSKMRPPMSKDKLPSDDSQFSLMDRVMYDGAVAGTIPATGLSGRVMIANDMEGDLSLAGIKQGALSTPVDFRNPCVGIDFGTIIDGRFTEAVPKGRDDPYARTTGCIIGLGGAIADALTRGTGEVDPIIGTAREFFGDNIISGYFSKKESKRIRNYVDSVHELIKVEEVAHNHTHVGLVPIDPSIAENMKIKIFGVDAGENFNGHDALMEIGMEVFRKEGRKGFTELVDRVMSRTALRLIRVAAEKKVFTGDMAIGFSGRAIMSGRKPEYVLEGVINSEQYRDPVDRMVFVSSALPRGAALMARCMSGLGNPKKPIGGCRGEACILGRRKRFQNM
ncbi:methanogenesis marker 14 protein [Methanocalculus taiwanensis]|uniref:Methanogenesis marker 14 protein n=1 Tax=Methanocalculus taiwanensis TaxID=106207 RepID=A0ABD4TGZ6_9EURY|nr:methanogenesis marker 14 protein [Methanocalculus taiwanensis]